MNIQKIKIKDLYYLAPYLLIIVLILTINYFNGQREYYKYNYVNLLNNIYFKNVVKDFFSKLDPKYESFEYKIKNGDTFSKITSNLELTEQEIKKIKTELKKFHKLNNLTPGLKIKYIVDKSSDEIVNFIFPINLKKIVLLERDTENNILTSKEITTKLNKKVIFNEGKISKSFYKSAIDLDIQPNVIIEFARLYGFSVDFQRDIRKNDEFQILHETFVDEGGKIIETGNIIYASLDLSGYKSELYFFKDEHFDKGGKSIRKALMKTPINGARLSSSYGMRKHPIDGFNKMHRGTDFAAPMGTPIMASGDGIIIRARWCGGGGNCVKIKHNSTYSTVYAHLSKFGKIKEKQRVKQGQIIGYVGSTGKSTGPHLHYEVIENGKRIDSQKLKLPSGKILKDEERKIFELERIKTDVLKSELISK